MDQIATMKCISLHRKGGWLVSIYQVTMSIKVPVLLRKEYWILRICQVCPGFECKIVRAIQRKPNISSNVNFFQLPASRISPKKNKFLHSQIGDCLILSIGEMFLHYQREETIMVLISQVQIELNSIAFNVLYPFSKKKLQQLLFL